MNRLDFVVWLIGWGYMIGKFISNSNPADKDKWLSAVVTIVMFCIWIAIAVLIY